LPTAITSTIFGRFVRILQTPNVHLDDSGNTGYYHAKTFTVMKKNYPTKEIRIELLNKFLFYGK